MGYFPKINRQAECEHFWRPLIEVGQPSENWRWGCVRCPIESETQPPGLTSQISRQDLEAMVDSSLRLADKVIVDDQSVRGELWLMRNAHWCYLPFEFQILYHILGGAVLILLFRYTSIITKGVWLNISDTDTYREVIQRADAWRRAQP